jgi:hypothetical protein
MPIGTIEAVDLLKGVVMREDSYRDTLQVMQAEVGTMCVACVFRTTTIM